MPITHTYQRRLRLYAQAEGSPTVCVALVGVVRLPDGSEQTFPLPDEYPEDAALQAHAEADQRSTWDESDLCALLDCERAPKPEPPAPSPVAPDAEAPA